MEKPDKYNTFWVVAYPKNWISKRANGWIYQPGTVSHTRTEAIHKCVKEIGKDWNFLYKNGRRCKKVTIQEVLNISYILLQKLNHEKTN